MDAAKRGGLTPAEAAAQRLRIDYAAAEVLRAFEAAGIESIVLKGAPLVRWLYEPGERRGYVDCDLLVRPDALDGAGNVLAALGFEPELDESDMPDWWREHGVEWLRGSDHAAVDLHRTIAGAGVVPERVWQLLSARTEPIEVAGQPARSLDIAGLALQLALHAAQHGGSTRQVEELERAVHRADLETWRDAARLAQDLDAVPAFATGLRFAPSGASLADRIGLPPATSTEAVLLAQGFAEPQTIERFVRAGTRQRLSIIRYKLIPPPTFMRKWSPLARRGQVGLLVAYLWRPLWVLARMPRALRQWKAARSSHDASNRSES